MGALSEMPRCAHHLFEHQARRTPDRSALAFEGERLSYGELEARASALARALRAAGAAPDARVVLLMERSLALVVGLLGILKAGAGYVPADPAYPRAHLRFIVEDADAVLVLTQRSLLPVISGTGRRILCVEDIDAAADGRPVPAAEAPGPESLAYVIYTSGSTGRPKGVCVEHRNIVSYTVGVAERLRLEPEMSYAHVSTIAADLGNTALFPALATGGCLHVVSAERSRNPALLADYFERERIDVLKITPSHIAALQEGSRPERVMPRRRLILGGEPVTLDRIARLRAMAPRCEIYNHYGPTETTVGVLTYRVDGALPATASGTLPLGTALPRARVEVLDQNGRPCATGELGELFIGGAGVARGYLRRPDLTAQRFVPDPCAAEAGARLYRSGDLGRRLPDGSIEFCGRVDDQLKLGGYRVEPAEIEHALREHGGVHEAVVLGRDAGGGKQLVAYVVPKPGANAEPSAAALRQHLGERLPPHMVPQAFVLLPRFPLLPNGKIDRLALPAGEAQQACAGYVAPRTPIEERLAGLWAELLGLSRVGVDDDFFDLGGKSLQAMRLVARVRDAFGVDMHLRHLFDRPTLAGLAELVEGMAWARSREAPATGSGREEIRL